MPFGFHNQWRSNTTNLIYMRNRWYSPSLGQFVSHDPLGYVDSYNPYAFVSMDPINFWDPWGLDDRIHAIVVKGLANVGLKSGPLSAAADAYAWRPVANDGRKVGTFDAELGEFQIAESTVELAEAWVSGKSKSQKARDSWHVVLHETMHAVTHRYGFRPIPNDADYIEAATDWDASDGRLASETTANLPGHDVRELENLSRIFQERKLSHDAELELHSKTQKRMNQKPIKSYTIRVFDPSKKRVDLDVPVPLKIRQETRKFLYGADGPIKQIAPFKPKPKKQDQDSNPNLTTPGMMLPKRKQGLSK